MTTLPAGHSLANLGEQRLRDLARPERVYELVGPGLPGEFPPLRSLDRLPHNLPIQATPFVGREQQLESLCARLLRPDVRLLTLTGPGGTGKTRLALQAAAGVLEGFVDGVFFVSLAALADPELVPSAIAQALDVKETAGRPALAALKDVLRERHVLLVLDNFEHLASAAPVITALLSAVPGMSVLATSRAALRLYGEHEFPVPPLALPDHRASITAAHAAQFEAVHLFVERVQAARPDFALSDSNALQVAELCRRLDGLPLALELAAARLRALPLPALLERMEGASGGLPLLTGGPRDLPTRQQTLRNTISWSYDLLDPGEQALFRRLSVFRGCTLDAVEAVCAAPATQPRSTSIALPPLGIEALDGVTSLVEKSLLRQGETEEGQPWYDMLETIREYAAECLEGAHIVGGSGEAPAVERRHILYYVRLAEAAAPELTGPQQRQWFARLEREHDNLRAAFDRCLALGYAEPAYRIAVSVWWFWHVHGHIGEGSERLARLLSRFPEPDGASRMADLRASAYFGAAYLTSIQGDYDAARPLHEQALALRRKLGNPSVVVESLEALGMNAVIQGDHEAAQRFFVEALTIARTLDNSELTATLLYDLANVLHEQGDNDAARELSGEAMALFSRLGSQRGLGSASLTRAIVAQDEGDYTTAQQLMEQALALYEDAGDPRPVALALAHLGSLATVRGDFALARERLAASLVIQQDLADRAGVAFVLDRFAHLATVQGRHGRAMHLSGAAAALRSVSGALGPPGTQAKLDAKLAPARQALGEPADAEAWRAGQVLSLSEAVAEALDSAEPGAAAVDGTASAGAWAGKKPAAGLTPREQEVACLIAQGCTNRQIAEALVITEGTAANHVVHILNKLGFSSRIQVAAWAVAHGLVDGSQTAGGVR